MKPLRIGTRGSALALWQARTVAAQLERAGGRIELVTIRTAGDRLQQAPLSEVGGKRLFVKEIEEALLRGEIDIAVHSAKDMPAELPDGLALAAALAREDPRDALVLRDSGGSDGIGTVVRKLGESPRVGTSSVRRTAQLAALIPHAVFAPMRGNVDTRLERLDGGQVDALVLAAAGLRRLGLEKRISAAIPVELCIPAPGQGIVAIETRNDDWEARRTVAPLDDPRAAAALAAERALVAALGGGCQLPLGAIALHDNADLDMQAIVISLDGRQRVEKRLRGAASDAAGLGRRLADELSRAGAGAILDHVRRATGPVQGSY